MFYHLPQKEIVLASASSTRQKMLADAGMSIRAEPAHVDEDSLKYAAQAEKASGLDAATLIAEMKAQKISALNPNAFVIGSDQLLTFGGDWFSKPESLTEAKSTLQKLSGKTHQLVTVGVVYENGKRLWHHAESPKISIRTLSEQDIDQYLEILGDDYTATPGVYMIEKLGAQIISKIDGCPYAVLGFPLLQLLSFLRQHGLTLKDQ